MPQGDGDGWVTCRCGRRHWGRFGAAGLLLVRSARSHDRDGEVTVLLQHRSQQVHDGGTWALAGGARDSHEDVVATALRETAEETGLGADDMTVVACVRGADHIDWTYTYVVALASPAAEPYAATFETQALVWVPTSAEVSDRTPLHPALARDWPTLMNVVGAVVSG